MTGPKLTTAATEAPTASGRLSWADALNPPRPTATRTPLELPTASVETTSYGRKALAEEAAAVAATPVGERNEKLNKAAFRIGQLIPHEVTQADAVESLTAAGLAAGLPAAEVARVLRLNNTGGLAKGMADPRQRGELPADVAEVDATELVTIGEHVDAAGQVWETFTGSTEADPVESIRAQFPPLDLAALLDPNRPPREWVVFGLIPAGASVALVAAAGTGKSLLSLAIAVAVSRGHRAFADLTIARRRRVLYLDMENTEDDLAERFPALGVTPGADLSDLLFLHLPPIEPLDTPAGGRQLEAIVDAYGLTAGDVVILDSFQRVVSGPENDADTLRALYRCAMLPLKRRGLTVVRLDNTGKDAERGARGTSGKRDDVDVELILTRDKDGDRFTLTPGKVRLPDIRPVTFTRTTEDNGRLAYSTAADPRRATVLDALAALDSIDPDRKLSQRAAEDKLKGEGLPRWAIRQAFKERRSNA